MRWVVALAILTVALLLMAAQTTEVLHASELAPAPTFDPSEAPAYPEVVHWALVWRGRAVRQWNRWNALRADAFAYPVVPFHRHSIRTPMRSASQSRWLAAGRSWKYDQADYRARYRKLWVYMTAPGGGGWERWRPLLRYTWPHSLVDTAVRVIRFESGGAAYRYNTAGSGAFGLMQLLPRPAGVWSPLSQLRYAYWRKYVPAGGWSPWSSCAAF